MAQDERSDPPGTTPPSDVSDASQACCSPFQRAAGAGAQTEESPTSFHPLCAHAPIGLVFFDQDLRFVRVNDFLASVDGLSVDEHPGRTLREILPGLALAAESLLRQTLATGQSILESELSGETPPRPGERRYFLASYYPVNAADGRRLGVGWILQEITERRRAEAALRESEAHLRALFAAMSDVVLVLDAAGRYREIAPTSPSLLYRPANELLGRTLHEVFPKPEADSFLEHIRRALATGQTTSMEYSLRIDNRELWFSAAISPLSADSVVFVARDVTERRRAEMALRESEERFRSLFQGIVAAVALFEVVYDESGQPVDYRYLDVNPALEAILGVSREQIVGRTVRERQPNVEEHWLEVARSIVLGGKPVRKVGYFRGIDKFADVGFFSPRPGQLAIAFNDVTEQVRSRQRIEELVGEAQRRTAELRAILDNMVEGLFVCDPDGRFTLVNRSGLRLLGLSSLAEVHLKLAELPWLLRIRHPNGRPIAPEELAAARALNGETVADFDEVVRDPRTGRDTNTRSSSAPIRDERGQVVGSVTVVRDVTELIQLSRLKDQFVAVAAHELKTPVTILKGYAQALLHTAGDLPAPRRRILEAINRGADRIDRIIVDLLDVSRLSLGQIELSVERVDLSLLAEEAVTRASLTAPKHHVFVARAEPVVVQGDRERLEQVLANLLDNAIRYSPSGGEVAVSVALRDHEAVVSVADQGVGIPKERQAHIFERFYRAHTGTPYDYGGMGVGLYISREIVARHGGRMWFESEEGKGSTFYFSVPINGGVRT